MTYRIKTDEECGDDGVWDALHDYADTHPAPPDLAPFVDRNVIGDFNGVVVDDAAGVAATAWLDRAAEALGWPLHDGSRITPVLVLWEEGDHA